MGIFFFSEGEKKNEGLNLFLVVDALDSSKSAFSSTTSTPTGLRNFQMSLPVTRSPAFCFEAFFLAG